MITSNRTIENLTLGTLKNVCLRDGFINELLDRVLDQQPVGPKVATVSFSNKLTGLSPDYFVTFISCFPSLKFVGPAERWSPDFADQHLKDALANISKANLDVKIAFGRKIHGGFDIANYNPWKYKYVVDKGR